MDEEWCSCKSPVKVLSQWCYSNICLNCVKPFHCTCNWVLNSALQAPCQKWVYQDGRHTKLPWKDVFFSLVGYSLIHHYYSCYKKKLLHNFRHKPNFTVNTILICSFTPKGLYHSGKYQPTKTFIPHLRTIPRHYYLVAVRPWFDSQAWVHRTVSLYAFLSIDENVWSI